MGLSAPPCRSAAPDEGWASIGTQTPTVAILRGGRWRSQAPRSDPKFSRWPPRRRDVPVDRRRLGYVADSRAQLRRAGRRAEHVYATGLDDLRADDATHERRLPAATRTQQAGDPAPGHREGEA